MFNKNEKEADSDQEYVDDKIVNLNELKEEKPYFMTLLHQHNKYMATKDSEEMLRDNEKNFIEAAGMS